MVALIIAEVAKAAEVAAFDASSLLLFGSKLASWFAAAFANYIDFRHYTGFVPCFRSRLDDGVSFRYCVCLYSFNKSIK